MPPRPPSPVVVCFTAAAALAVAMGIGRFAFTPMLPLMVRDGVLSMDAGSRLAAANYLGYLIGALTAARLPWRPALTARLALIGVAAVTAGMSATTQLSAWLVLRGLAGVFSGWALVGVSAWALHELAEAGRSRLAAVVYSGVGSGVALAGLFCLVAAGPGVSSARLWLELGVLTLIAIAAPLVLIRGGPRPAPRRPSDGGTENRTMTMLILCYGVFGFGYILPATFLPALARQIVDDPRVFGLVWPAFGAAAALSTLFAGAEWIQANRVRAWAGCHGLMALGALLPSLWLTAATLGASALLIGGTFMIVTMLGMQEARVRAPHHPSAALGRMTAAFAVGQFAGPLAISAAPAGGAALSLGLQAAGLALILTIPALWRIGGDGKRAA